MKEIAQQVQLRTQVKQVPVMIVNDEIQQYAEIKTVVAVCPECNSIVTSFSEELNIMDLYKALSNAEIIQTIASSFPKYCPQCGQKLNFTFEPVIEVRN